METEAIKSEEFDNSGYMYLNGLEVKAIRDLVRRLTGDIPAQSQESHYDLTLLASKNDIKDRSAFVSKCNRLGIGEDA